MPKIVESPITDIFFDVDSTLILSYSWFSNNDDSENLSPIPLKLFHGGENRYFAINVVAMRLIFQALLDNGITIHFITSSIYSAEYLNPALELLYELPTGSLKNCKCINRYDFGAAIESEFSVKIIKSRGEIIVAAQDAGLISKDAKILLVDDLPANLKSVRELGFKAIAACGYPLPVKDVGPIIRSNFYLRKIIEVCSLDVVLPANLNASEAHEQLVKQSVAILGIEQIAKWSRLFDLPYFLHFVREHKFDLLDLKRANANGDTPIFLATSIQDCKLIQALLLILDHSTNDMQAIIAEGDINNLLYDTKCCLQQCQTLYAIDNIERAREIARSLSIYLEQQKPLVFDRRYAQKGYFDPVIRKLYSEGDAYLERKHILPTQYANKIILAALESCQHDTNKTLLERHQKRLTRAITSQFDANWWYFDRKTDDEMQPFFEYMIRYISNDLSETSWRKRLGNFSNAGLYLQSSSTIKNVIKEMFVEYKQQTEPKKIELPIPLPLLPNKRRQLSH